MAAAHRPAEHHRRVRWPPKVIRETPLGLMRDSTGTWYSRDIGRSTSLVPHGVVFQFGDTFSHDAKDEYIGTTDNTISLARDPSNPSLSTYPDPAYKSDASAIEPFIDCFQEGSKAINKLWSFSGIVITEADVDAEHMLGWTWFEVRHPGATLDDWKYRGMGIVRVIVDSHEGKSRIRTDGRSTVRLSSGGPAFGNFCAIGVEKWIYLYGHYDPTNDKRVCLARALNDDPTDWRRYWHWNGESWSRSINNPPLGVVFNNMQHGQVFPTRMFGLESPCHWAFIGCNATGDSKVQMGRAQLPEGPWDVHELRADLYSLSKAATGPGYFYCVYPHPWADATERTGDLTISWSEGGLTGGVLMAKLRFQMEHDSHREAKQEEEKVTVLV